MNRVMSGSMPKPGNWRAQPSPRMGGVARLSMKSRRRRPSPLMRGVVSPLGSGRGHGSTRCSGTRRWEVPLGSGRGRGSTRCSGTRRWEAHGGSARWNDARSAGDLTSPPDLWIIAHGGREAAVERARPRRPEADAAAERERRSRSRISVEAGCGKRKGRGEEGFEDVGGERQCGGWLPPAGEVEELWPVVGWSTRTRFTGEWNQRGWQGKVYITPQLLGVDCLTPNV